jgi:3-hydroxyacyl-[acyl-carrier-protein] dehydratase
MTKESLHHPVIFNAKQIAQILPHRYPFLLVDKIIELDLEGNRIVGLKNVTMNEPFFQGHFPGAPIMPGVLIIEALAQTGGVFIAQKGYGHKIAVLLHMSDVKFRKPVVPGDTLILEVNALHLSGRAGKVKGKAFVEGQLAVEAEIAYALMDKSQI